MPNWCHCKLRITGPRVGDVLAAVRTEDAADADARVFDFDKVIPQPASVKVAEEEVVPEDVAEPKANEDVNLNDPAVQAILKKLREAKGKRVAEEEDVPPEVEAELRARRFRLRQGRPASPDWYTWRVEHWGTKWNAVNVEVSDDGKGTVLFFNTAWSPPAPVICALGRKFPDHTFRLTFTEPHARVVGRLELRGERVLAEDIIDVEDWPRTHPPDMFDWAQARAQERQEPGR